MCQFFPCHCAIWPVAIYRHHNPVLAQAMHDKTFDHDDAIFTNVPGQFVRIGGGESGIIYVLDEVTLDVVLVVKINLFKDMSCAKRKIFQRIVDFFGNDKKFHAKVTCNGAHLKGGGKSGDMRVAGWRPAMVKGEAFGTYAPHSHLSEEKMANWKTHVAQSIEIHRIFADSFSDLAPGMYANQKKELKEFGVPALGVDFEDNQHPFIYCSNLVHTCSK